MKEWEDREESREKRGEGNGRGYEGAVRMGGGRRKKRRSCQ